MAYRFEQGESVTDGVRRLANEQLVRAIGHLESEDGERDVHIHEARKATKRLRALVRMVRYQVRKDVYRLEIECSRTAGRRLAGMRDATVMIEALDRLVESLGSRAPRSRFEPVRDWLVERRRLAYAHGAAGDESISRALGELHAARERVPHWPLRNDEWQAIGPGLRQVYAQGQEELAAACREPSDEKLHAWRRRVKYLWYHAQLLQAVWPPVMVALVGELDRLGQLLGWDHDLAVLHHILAGEYPGGAPRTTLQALDRRLRERRAELQAAARQAGERLYAEKPRDFGRRLRRYWEVWEAESPAASPPEPQA